MQTSLVKYRKSSEYWVKFHAYMKRVFHPRLYKYCLILSCIGMNPWMPKRVSSIWSVLVMVWMILYLMVNVNFEQAHKDFLLFFTKALTNEQVLDRVWNYIRKEQIIVLPRTWQMWSRKQETWGQDVVGLCDHDQGIIWLREDHWRNPWTLLHELGHRKLFEEGKIKHFEEEADDAGRQIVLGLLTKREAKRIDWIIDIWLPPLGWKWSENHDGLIPIKNPLVEQVTEKRNERIEKLRRLADSTGSGNERKNALSEIERISLV